MSKTELPSTSTEAENEPDTYAVQNTMDETDQQIQLREDTRLLQTALYGNHDDIQDKVTSLVESVRAKLWNEEITIRRTVQRMILKVDRLIVDAVRGRKRHTYHRATMGELLEALMAEDDVCSISVEIDHIHRQVDSNICESRCAFEEKVDTVRYRVEAFILDMRIETEEVIHGYRCRAESDYPGIAEDMPKYVVALCRDLDNCFRLGRRRMEKQIRSLNDEFESRVENFRVQLDYILQDLHDRFQNVLT